MRDRGVSEQSAIAMIDAQIPIDEKKKAAKWVIDNDGDLDDLRLQIDRFLQHAL
jgi:dephospho-CoA kinase